MLDSDKPSTRYGLALLTSHRGLRIAGRRIRPATAAESSSPGKHLLWKIDHPTPRSFADIPRPCPNTTAWGRWSQLDNPDTITCVGFLLRGKRLGSGLAGATVVLLIATLFFTNWGMSSPKPVIRIAWSYLISACVSELALVVYWILGDKMKRQYSDSSKGFCERDKEASNPAR